MTGAVTNLGQPPWEFLLSASRNSLQRYELSRLAHAANLRKEIGALLDQWLGENACAMLARWLIEQRERPPRVPEHTAGDLFSASSHSAFSSVLSSLPGSGAHSASDNDFADRPVPSAEIRGPA
jgi:hypothetical protein